MRELQRIDAVKDSKAIAFEAAMSDKEASDKATQCSVNLEATYDGATWEHVAGYVNWQGGEVDHDGKPAKPSISVARDGQREPKAYRVVTDAKADSTISVGKLEAAEVAAIEVRK